MDNSGQVGWALYRVSNRGQCFARVVRTWSEWGGHLVDNRTVGQVVYRVADKSGMADGWNGRWVAAPADK